MARRWCFVAVALAIGCGDTKRDAPRAAPVAKPALPAPVLSVKLSGTVIDRATGAPVGDVDVVLHGDD
jgi:hypothetical protein